MIWIWLKVSLGCRVLPFSSIKFVLDGLHPMSKYWGCRIPNKQPAGSQGARPARQLQDSSVSTESSRRELTIHKNIQWTLIQPAGVRSQRRAAPRVAIGVLSESHVERGGVRPVEVGVPSVTGLCSCFLL